ncbi:MAG: FtsW/RodA/SpoVE family cell cycle protein [Acidimicrobiia bacterium]|nr:FtsW/RodA/SpoVE family cell cycle protein [Acidimicrobiia bacterium]
MSRTAEGALILAAAMLGAFGVALVNIAGRQAIGDDVALTFFVMITAFGALHAAVRRWAPNGSPYLIPLAALLTAVGLSEIYRLNPAMASLQKWWLLIGAGLGILTLWGLSSGGTQLLRRYRYIMLLSALGLLVLPLLPQRWPLPLRGLAVNGSRLWVSIDLGVIQMRFQPGEIVKLLIVGFLASFLAERHEALAMRTRKFGPFELPEPRQMIPILVAWFASFGVMIYQRDLGASLLLFSTFIAMMYVATARNTYLVVGGGLFALGSVAAWSAFTHVQTRLEAWLVPFEHYETTGYQISNGIFAMASGSLSGTGLGLGRPSLIAFAPTDFIFAAVGEELGLVGSVLILAIYALMVSVGMGIALRSRDLFRKLLAAGLTFSFGLQSLLIIGGIVRLFPLTGITLPFMSYGGSSLVSNFVLVALLVQVSHEERV